MTMGIPDLIFITGCNAAGKSSLIRTHLSLFPDYEVIMTDVYKTRAHDVPDQYKNVAGEIQVNANNLKFYIILATSILPI